MSAPNPQNMDEAVDVLQHFHRCLNHAGLLPEKAYRRNSALYPMVCYVNNIIGALLSENYKVVPIFVARAAEHLSQSPRQDVEPYYRLVESYLAHVIAFVQMKAEGIEFDVERIPSDLFKAGFQKAPILSMDSAQAIARVFH